MEEYVHAALAISGHKAGCGSSILHQGSDGAQNRRPVEQAAQQRLPSLQGGQARRGQKTMAPSADSRTCHTRAASWDE